MSGSKDLREIYTQHVEKIRSKFAKDLMSVLDDSPLPEADLSDKGITVDKSSKDVYWSEPPGKPLRVSYELLTDNCCYLEISRGDRILYHHTNEPESLMLSCYLNELVTHPENYPDGEVREETTTKVFNVNSQTGDIVPPTTASSNEKIFRRIMGFSYTLICSNCKPPAENFTVLWQLTFASLKNLGNDTSRNGARCHEKLDAKSIKPGTVGNITFSANEIGKSGRHTVLATGEYRQGQGGDVLPTVLSANEIGKSGRDTVLVEGEYRQGQGGDVFLAMVKIIKKGHNDGAVWNEIRDLHRFAGKRNVIGFYGWEEDEHFFYLAFESCDTNLRDFILSLHKPESQDWKDREKVLKRSTEMVLKGIRGMLRSCSYTRVFLGNIDISDIFLNKHADLKISVISEKTKLPLISSLNSVRGFPNDSRVDVTLPLFRLIFFIIAGVEYKNEDLTKPTTSDNYLKPIYGNPEALDLLRILLHPAPWHSYMYVFLFGKRRLDVPDHPLFWCPKRKLKFILRVGEYLETEDWNSELSKALNSIGEIVFGDDWCKCLDDHVLLETVALTAGFQLYTDDYHHTMRGLIKFIRSLTINETEIREEYVDGYAAPSPYLEEIFLWRDFGSCFFRRFPKLVIEVYNITVEKGFEKLFSPEM